MTTRRTVLATGLSLVLCSLFAGLPAMAADAPGRISVTTEGSGPDVVLIPGLNSSPRVWREMIKAVPGYRYHLVQVAGFAGAPAGANVEGLVSAPVAEEVANYIDANIIGKKLPKPAVIGHSMGGTIGLMLASRHPDSVSRLMVVDMTPFLGAMFGPPGTTSASITPTADGILAGMRSADPAARRARAIGTINSMVNTESMRQGAIDDSLGSTADVSARAYHELVVTDLRPELANIKAPTTVLYVAPKGFMTAEQADAFYQAAYATLKAVKLKRVDNTAHFLMWDQPAVFQASVKEFLK